MGLGDCTPLRQAAEKSGYSRPAEIAPVRGDWLVELRGIELMIAAFGYLSKRRRTSPNLRKRWQHIVEFNCAHWRTQAIKHKAHGRR